MIPTGISAAADPICFGKLLCNVGVSFLLLHDVTGMESVCPHVHVCVTVTQWPCLFLLEEKISPAPHAPLTCRHFTQLMSSQTTSRSKNRTAHGSLTTQPITPRRVRGKNRRTLKRCPSRRRVNNRPGSHARAPRDEPETSEDCRGRDTETDSKN